MTQFVDAGLSTRVRVPGPDEVPTDSGDAYPACILDQRAMLPDGHQCETGEDVLNLCWVPFLAKNGKTVVADERAVVPYISHSRWVADCPECNGAAACWDRNPYCCCLDCGRVYKVKWQPPHERAEIVRLIAGRPPEHRNWDAHKGEGRDELVIQNILMDGVAPEKRDGLLVAANVVMPKDFGQPQEYLDHLQTLRRKKH